MTNTEKRSDYVRRALERLSQPDLINLRDVFGRILERRCAHSDTGCFLLDNLAQGQDRYLKTWEEECATYVRYLRNPQTAASKADDDLLWRATTCPRKEFDAHFADFAAEMAAVRELGKIGYYEFQSVPRKEGVKTVDYRAKYETEEVCIEVKNLRSPITILDVFVAELRAQHAAEPAKYPFRFDLLP